jgi:thymidine phosphorylase
MMSKTSQDKYYNPLRLKYLGINTYKEKVLYLPIDAHVCRSEGFEVHARVKVTVNQKSIIATLNFVERELLSLDEAGLSNAAWESLNAKEGDQVLISHTLPLQSFNSVRSKIYGHTLSKDQIQSLIEDITAGLYSDIEITAFLSACAGGRLTLDEIVHMAQAMIDVGDRLTWDVSQIVDKHCVGGLPGNRTSLIVVPIVASYGLMMPKTSSRAITSPAGTADTMEVLAPVNLSLEAMHKVVNKENGCVVWGGSVSLSPADDILIAVERVLDIDSEGQLIASVLSKKIAAGSTHILIDIPVGPTAKVRTLEMARLLKIYFQYVAEGLGVTVKIIQSDGQQPVGRGIGPSLEARDVLSVLQNKADAPLDLRDRSLDLAGHILEFSENIPKGKGRSIAAEILSNGQAWKKFQAICEAQGGFREPRTAQFTHTVEAKEAGKIKNIDNRRLARVAKLAGAPHDQTAGVDLHLFLDALVHNRQPLFTIHANSQGQLSYALDYLVLNKDIIEIEKE